MENILNLIPGHVAYALGYSILHSFWQAAALLLLVLLLQYFVKKPDDRYLLLGIALLVQVLMSAITYRLYYTPAIENFAVKMFGGGAKKEYLKAEEDKEEIKSKPNRLKF